jgi:hypothetical protein
MVSTRTKLLWNVQILESTENCEDHELTHFYRDKRSAANRRLPAHPKLPSLDEEVAAEMAGNLRLRRLHTTLRRRKRSVSRI